MLARFNEFVKLFWSNSMQLFCSFVSRPKYWDLLLFSLPAKYSLCNFDLTFLKKWFLPDQMKSLTWIANIYYYNSKTIKDLILAFHIS